MFLDPIVSKTQNFLAFLSKLHGMASKMQGLSSSILNYDRTMYMDFSCLLF